MWSANEVQYADSLRTRTRRMVQAALLVPEKITAGIEASDLKRLLLKLPQDYRVVLTLWLWCEMTDRQIGARLHESSALVYQRRHEAIERLRNLAQIREHIAQMV